MLVPAAFPGSGWRIHHTRSAGIIVSMFIGLGDLSKDSFSRRQTSLRVTEQISIRSLKKDAAEGNFGLPFALLPDTVCSSSESTDDDDEDEAGKDSPKESFDSGDNRGVALIVCKHEPVISVGGRICCILGGGILRSSSSESHGNRLHSRAEGR